MSSSLATNKISLTTLHQRASFNGKTVLLAIVTAFIIIVNLFVHPSRFADYDSYTQFTDYIYHYSQFSWLYFEPLSSLMLFLLRLFNDSADEAVNLSHYLLGFIFIFLNYQLIRYKNVNWQGYAIFIALYGSLLAFVTFRATAAYLIVVIAFFEAMAGKKRSYIYVLISSLFHISGLLALPIIIILFYESKIQFLQKIFINKYFILTMTLLFSTIYIIYGNLFSLTFTNILNSVSFLSKYATYTAEIDTVTGVILDSGRDKFFHTVYAAAVSLFALSIILSNNENCVRIRGAVLIGYIIFIVMQFSPVTAFRQSIFWMTPALLIYPWSKLHFRRYGAVPFTLLCIGLTIYQFQSTYS